jgi:glycosyltransferase involved in cell wall biosynthesis
MKILYLSQYFPPEVGATQARAYDMATGLIRAGHQVTILTEVPNHPEGIIRPEYRGRLFAREILDDIDVIRVWVKTSSVKSISTRLLFYLSYMVSATLAGLILVRGDYDLLYATSPPLFVGGAALALSTLRRLPLVFEVRDLWPESAVALGELKNPRFIRWSTWLEERCYRRARRIVVVTQGIRARLMKRGLPSEKLVLIPNGSNTERFYPQPEAAFALRRQLGLEGRFLLIYAGIHGIAQGLETVLEAAHRLKDIPDIHFLFVGDGPSKAHLVRLKEELGLRNVTMMEGQPREAIPIYLSAANAALVPLRRLELFKGALPSKMLDAWACGVPVILAAEGEARELLEEARAGISVEPENSHALVQAIKRLKGNPALLEESARNGRNCVLRNFDRGKLAGRLERVLLEVMKEGKGAICQTPSEPN